ncbi:MAG: D-alanyl-D-alanine carboxypeptidase/D-alanyl-D-alanine-endopeptidase [Microscillaceae bacterium]|nr:D-alanyl-D-alanine carboxypeptidase/D-alanyl-D-alanine-endopeptidase [Microscillaceae bacterium]
MYALPFFKNRVGRIGRAGLFLLTCSQNTPQNPSAVSTPLRPQLEKLRQALQTLEGEAAFRAGLLSFSLAKVETGEELLALNAQKMLNTASVMKALTTASALALLGKSYQFATHLEYDGQIEAGVLKGNLYIKGQGDPILGSSLRPDQDLARILAVWSEKIRQAGIRRIEGHLIADESAFAPGLSPAAWLWGDMGNYFGAPAGAINVLDNTYKLYFRPGALGQPAQIVKTEPQIPEIYFFNEVKTAGPDTGDQASISGAPYDPVRYVSGTVPMGGIFTIKGAIPDPAYWLVHRLASLLEGQGISCTAGPATTTRLTREGKQWPDTRRIRIHTHLSPPLSAIVGLTNAYSINLYAEALLKALPGEKKSPLSTITGLQALQEYWAGKGIDLRNFRPQDGSGLAPTYGLTTSLLTQILHKIRQEAYFEEFYASLPIAGVSGTMLSVASDSRAKNNLRAKSGAMTGVLAYAGYFKTSNGELMAFALAANRYQGEYPPVKKLLSDFMGQMVESF